MKRLWFGCFACVFLFSSFYLNVNAVENENEELVSDQSTTSDSQTGLSAEVEEQIKRDYYDFWVEYSRSERSETGFKDVVISAVYGEYHGCIALMIRHASEGFTQALRTKEIGGYRLTYKDGQSILVWKDGQFYSLENAYNQGILTQSDVGEICTSYTK